MTRRSTGCLMTVRTPTSIPLIPRPPLGIGKSSTTISSARALTPSRPTRPNRTCPPTAPTSTLAPARSSSMSIRSFHRGIRRRLNAGLRAEDDDAGLVGFLLFLANPGDVFPGSLLLRRRDAVGAVQGKEHVHAFHLSHPLEASDRKHEGSQHDGANHQRGPTSPGADLHIGLPRKPEHPRQRRHQQQQVIGMGELEVHCRSSFCTRWFWESAT